MSIAIVTDSTCDIPNDLVDRFDIHVVPNILVIQGQSIEDNRDFSRQDFYTRLPGMNPLPTTSTASSGKYQALFDELLTRNDRVLSILASSHLSGIFNAASLAAQPFGDRIRVIDSRQVSLGLGFQVLAAAEAALNGLSIEAIQDIASEIRTRVRLVAMLDTLEYIRRSGRVSWAQASFGSLLKIKLFVELKDGLVERLGEVRTRAKGITRLLEILQTLGSLERLAILHTNAEAEAHQLLEAIHLQLREKPFVVNVTTVIGTHVGPNGLGFVTLLE